MNPCPFLVSFLKFAKWQTRQYELGAANLMAGRAILPPPPPPFLAMCASSARRPQVAQKVPYQTKLGGTATGGGAFLFCDTRRSSTLPTSTRPVAILAKRKVPILTIVVNRLVTSHPSLPLNTRASQGGNLSS